MRPPKSKALAVLQDYGLILFGCFVYVISWTSFMIPGGVVNGGLTGLCAIIELGTGLPVAYSYIVINAILIIVGSIIMGRGFGFKTIFAILVNTVLFRVMPLFPALQAVPGNFLFVEERILIPIIGGLLEAVGISIIFSRGGSTGGTDILAIVINKFWPVSLGLVFVLCDLVIIASILLIPGKTFSDMIYGYVAMICFSLGVDYITTGRKSSVQLLVFSDNYEKIADYVNKVMNRGVTALSAVGWYTRKDKKVLLIMVRKYETSQITRAIKDIDPKAFVSISPATGVFGEGFEEMKTGIKKKK